MDSDKENLPYSLKPLRLERLASCVEFPGRNTLLHRFVLDHSRSGAKNDTACMLRFMSDAPAHVVNKLNSDGYSALHLAVLKNNLQMVKKLLACLSNVDVDCRCTGRRDTALHMAANLGRLAVIIELLNKGADKELCNKDNKTALCLAARSAHMDAMRLLVSQGARVNMVWFNGGSPLCDAVRSGNFAAVAFLVGCGANIHENGESPLRIAAWQGNLETVEFLVNRGAHVNATYCCTNSLLHDPIPPKVAAFLLDRGADLHDKDRVYGRTPLHFAVMCRNLEAVKLFVSRGANLDAIDKRGYTPLHHAVEEANLEVVEFLIDHGASLEAVELFGRKPLHLASMARNLDAVKLLIAKNAVVNATDAYGCTALHHAVNEGCLEMAEFLINHRADFRAADDNGWTPLHIAACFGRARIVRMLVDRGADIRARNKSFKTPLDLAREANQNQLCIEALQNLGFKSAAQQDASPMT